jgi:SWI/SNF-related matrix-associated actin-dependent regulator of chromatin subfamily A3
VAASQVIMGDSWWAPSIEDQAVDRVNRLGQTRRVTVFRLVMKDSVEERYESQVRGANFRVLEIQQRKRKMISDAFNEKKDKQVRETRMADLNLLLSGRRGNNTSGANTTGASRTEAIEL